MSNPDRILRIEDFPVTRVVTTRWADNDAFKHMNNAVHYQIFDSVINGWLAEHLPEFVATGKTFGVVAESGCSYFDELKFPDDVVVGLRVERLGTTSVTYGLGLVGRPRGEATSRSATIAAKGRWVHVYVDATSRRPTPIEGRLRALLETARAPS